MHLPSAFLSAAILAFVARGDSNNAVVVSNSIVTGASHYGLHGGAPGRMGAAYCDVWGSGVADLVQVVDGGGLFSADPLFLDAERGNFALSQDSPCVDAADPTLGCFDEPRPAAGLCRGDLGHLFGTPLARTR